MQVTRVAPDWPTPSLRLLTVRATLQSQLVALENTIRGLLRQEGIGLTDRRTAFEAAVNEAIGDDHLLQAALHPLLETRNAVLQHRAALDRQIMRIVRAASVCRLLMTAPGVGALVSLAFKVAVDDPRRFSRSRDVGAHFGLTPREHSSGELSYHGRISKMGDCEVRRLLYVAASRMLRRDAALWCPLKVWAVRLAQRVGIRRARVALARKLAVVLHAMWSDGQVFQWRRSEASA
jgi:transposase